MKNLNNDALLNAQNQIKKALEISWTFEVNKDNYEIISQPQRVIEVNIPVEMDNWSIKVFTWYRSQHSDIRWPFKWWIRFHPDVNLNEVKALSIWMSIKCSVVNIPLWWWKWWIIVDVKSLSINELEKLSRWYVKALYKYLWPEVDVPAPDVNTNPQIMAWMMDEYSKLVWKNSFWSFTWKPLSVWGSLWRGTATATWWYYVLEKILELKNINLKDKKVIVEWAWNAWLIMIEILSKKWVKIIWVSDSKWAIYNENWLDISEIVSLKKSKKSVMDYSKEHKFLTNNELLEIDCDILIPAALENRITSENAWKVKASIILELANGPTTKEADEILFERWITVIPDVLANAWWVMVSYFEQVQNNTNFYWSEREIDEKLKTKITYSAQDVFDTAIKHNTYLRNWAYIIATKRIFDAINDRK